jgi:2-keto-3-deoxy-6-phosphogluconate aldolase
MGDRQEGSRDERRRQAVIAGTDAAAGPVQGREVETALGLGVSTLKVFPAGPIGGVPYLR